MPAGHTNRDTINKRRPMSTAMVALLREAASPGGTYITSGSPDVSRIRALSDRGYVRKSDVYAAWRATDAGRAALAEL